MKKRKKVHIERNIGATKLYSLINNPSINDSKIIEIRNLYKELNVLLIRSYGWDNEISCEMSFENTRVGDKYTLNQKCSESIFNKLLELSNVRHSQENS